jgi:hypothetical protein
MKLDQSVAVGQRCVVNPVERGIREIPARTVANGVVFIDQIDADDLKDGTLVRYRVLAGVGEGEPLPASAK